METFLVDIPLSIRRRAKEIANRQQQSAQAEVVYLNNLAVYATHVYMRCLGIPVDIEHSDSQNILFQTLLNTAALMLSGLGKVECRPVASGAEVMYVPEDVWGDRIGYIAVQLNEDLSTATLLGFVPSVDSQEIPLTKLESLSLFLDRLEALELEWQAEPQPMAAAERTWSLHRETVSDLGQWLNHTVETGWQIIEDLIDNWPAFQTEPAIAFRQSTVSQSSADKDVIQVGLLCHIE
ncbi:MAG: DUF1822 family protein [Leptolyngbya sp. SIO4C5]|nr:DUF1822 family protein [Leptolyngbya sp. SIO4C5]